MSQEEYARLVRGYGMNFLSDELKKLRDERNHWYEAAKTQEKMLHRAAQRDDLISRAAELLRDIPEGMMAAYGLKYKRDQWLRDAGVEGK